MKKRLLAMTLVLAMLVSVFPSLYASADDFEPTGIPAIEKYAEYAKDDTAINKILPAIVGAIEEADDGDPLIYTFNIGANDADFRAPCEGHDEDTSLSDGSQIGIITTEADLGMMVEYGEYVYLVSDTATSVTFFTDTGMAELTSGYFNEEGSWIVERERAYSYTASEFRSTITCNAGEAIRFKSDTELASELYEGNVDVVGVIITETQPSFVATSANLACGRHAFVTNDALVQGDEGFRGKLASNTTDGDKTTVVDPDVLQAAFDLIIDLEEVISVKGFAITGSNATEYSISVATTTENWLPTEWTTVVSGVAGDEGTVYIVPDMATSARFVRYSSDGGVSSETLKEIEVFSGSKAEAAYGADGTVVTDSMFNVAYHKILTSAFKNENAVYYNDHLQNYNEVEGQGWRNDLVELTDDNDSTNLHLGDRGSHSLTCTVDLEQEYTLKVLSISYTAADHMPFGTLLYTSLDGKNWTQIGEHVKPRENSSNQKVYYTLTTPIRARYVRVFGENLLVGSSNYTGLSEIRAFTEGKLEAVNGPTTTVGIGSLTNVAYMRHVEGGYSGNSWCGHGSCRLHPNDCFLNMGAGLVDGQTTDAGGDNNTYTGTTQKVNGWAIWTRGTVDLEAVYPVEVVEITTGTLQDGSTPPAAVTVYASADGKIWNQIGGRYDVPSDGGAEQVIYFTPSTPVNARYVRYSVHWSYGSAEYWWVYTREMRVYADVPPPVEASVVALKTSHQGTKPTEISNSANVALHKPVTPKTFIDGDGTPRSMMSWEGNITNGELGNYAEFISTPRWNLGGEFTLDLLGMYDINGFGVANCIGDLDGEGSGNDMGVINKLSYVVQVSEDGESWVQVGNDYFKPTDENISVHYFTPEAPIRGRYVRFLTNERINWNRIMELMVFAENLPAATSTATAGNLLDRLEGTKNIARGRTMTADASVNDILKLTDGSYANDNFVQYNDYQGKKEWNLTLDMGKDEEISAIDIAFPIDVSDATRNGEFLVSTVSLAVYSESEGVWQSVGGVIDTSSTTLRVLRVTPDEELSGRYLRLSAGLNGNDFYWHRITELAVWSPLAEGDAGISVVSAVYDNNDDLVDILIDSAKTVTKPVICVLMSRAGEIKEVAIAPSVNITPGDNTVQLPLTETILATDIIRVMVWDSLDAMRPACPAVLADIDIN